VTEGEAGVGSVGIEWELRPSDVMANEEAPQVLAIAGLLELPDLDSNQDKENQNLPPGYPDTTRHPKTLPVPYRQNS
jgi:hypothetical protein